MNFNAFKNEIPSSRGIWSMLQCSTVNLHNAINTRHDSYSKNLWEFIDRVESLISCESGSTEESSLWTGRSLIDCGILRLLLKEEKREALPSKKKDLYKTLDSPIRRYIQYAILRLLFYHRLISSLLGNTEQLWRPVVGLIKTQTISISREMQL
jgi:hypothetical protein